MILFNLVKPILLLAFLWLVYKYFLESKNNYKFNRWYLLSSVLFSLSFPLINFRFEHSPKLPSSFGNPIVTDSNIETIFIAYIGITLLMAILFIRKLMKLNKMIKKGKVYRKDQVDIVLIEEQTLPFSFFNAIVTNKTDFHFNGINSMILEHEQTHIAEKHSYDIIFMEVIKIFFWFNPFIYPILNSVKLNHEFLADASVLRKNNLSIEKYQNLLLNLASNPSNSLTSAVNYKMTKKRFIMMFEPSNNISQWKISVFTILFSLGLCVGVSALQYKIEHTHDNYELHSH